MISVSEALKRLFSISKQLDSEAVPLAQAAGRVLSNEAVARLTQPPFASSAMDGYAVINDEAQSGMSLNVVGESTAGQRFEGRLTSGNTIRIFTGAPVPTGADCIVIQEDVIRNGDTITIKENREARTYIRPAGGDFTKGDTLTAPRRISPADVALLAAMNIPEVQVVRKPIVALIPTGNELVMPGEIPGPDQIISSNNFGLKALLEQNGASVRMLPIARDSIKSLQHTLDLADGVDLIITLGGASVGDHDLVQTVAVKRGLSVDFYKVAMQPGKPLMAGMLGEIPMVGLPGNPVSTMVCGHIFVRPMLNAMLGFPPKALPRETGQLDCAIEKNGPREHYMRASIKHSPNGWSVMPFDRQDSSLLSVLGQADVLMVRPPHDSARSKGDTIEFLRI